MLKRKKRQNNWVAAKGKIDDLNDSNFDFEFWQSQNSAQRFASAWELVRHYHLNILKQNETELRLNRSIIVTKRA